MFWDKKVKLTMPLFVLLAICLGMSKSALADSIIGWGSMAVDSEELDADDFTAIAAGAGNSLALKSDGSIVGWGKNNYGQATPPDGNDFVAIAAHWDHCLALKSNGSIVGWGSNSSGQVTPPDSNDFVAIATGGGMNCSDMGCWEFGHSLALKSDGYIVGWGDNDYGQATPPEGNDFVAIAAGGRHSLALKSDGSIVCWGRNGWDQATPPDGNDFVAIAAGNLHSLALQSNGSIIGWGNNEWGQATPHEGNDFVAIAGGQMHSLALKSDGSIVGWGNNEWGQATPPEGNDFVAITAGERHSLAIKSDGSIICWGKIVPCGNDFVAIAAGGNYSLALKYNGSIVGWNSSYYYDGWGDPIWLSQVLPPDGNDFVAIATSGSHSLALKSNGSIVGWGEDNYGQATVPDGNDFVAIAAGGLHSLALRSNGSIVGWGRNNRGQATPPEGNNFVAIAAGLFHGLALKSDGSIISWGISDGGSSDYGQVTDTPVGNDFVAIAAGQGHSLALKSDGSIVAWGKNKDLTCIMQGQFCYYTYTGQCDVPTPNSDFVAIAAGSHHSLALKSDGYIIGWGRDSGGQATPPNGNNFVAIAAGGSHSLAIKRKTIDAKMKLTPKKVNFKSNDKWITASLWLPEEYNVADIEPTSVVLEGKIEPEQFQVNEHSQVATARFKIKELQDILKIGQVEMAIAGRLTDWTIFEGTDTIKIIDNSVRKKDHSLVAHWKFDDGSGKIAIDSAGKNDGILIGDPTWTTGIIDGAISFDGDGDYVSVDAINALAGDTFTIQAWICLSEFAGIWNPVLIQHDLSNDGCYFYVASGRPSFYIFEGSNSVQAVSTEAINADQWYPVAITNDGSKLNLYVDGLLKTTTSSVGIKGADYNAYIGREIPDPLYYNGLIDDVRIYDRALTADEIIPLPE